MQCHLVARHYICELCNAILLQRHYICELCNAMLFSQSSCMWIISCYHFLYYVFHLSTTFVYSTTLPVHQPFEAVMEVSGVKTRYSEQTMLPAKADILLDTESSSEEDSETDDQYYFPLEVYAQTWQGYITHVMHVVLHCLVFTSYMDCHLLTCLLYKSYIWIISCHHVYIVHTHHLSELWHGNPFNKDII